MDALAALHNTWCRAVLSIDLQSLGLHVDAEWDTSTDEGRRTWLVADVTLGLLEQSIAEKALRATESVTTSTDDAQNSGVHAAEKSKGKA